MCGIPAQETLANPGAGQRMAHKKPWDQEPLYKHSLVLGILGSGGLRVFCCCCFALFLQLLKYYLI